MRRRHLASRSDSRQTVERPRRPSPLPHSARQLPALTPQIRLSQLRDHRSIHSRRQGGDLVVPVTKTEFRTPRRKTALHASARPILACASDAKCPSTKRRDEAAARSSSGGRRGGSTSALGGRMTPALDRVCRGTKTAEPPIEAHPEQVQGDDPNPSPHGINGTPSGDVAAVRECWPMSPERAALLGNVQGRTAE